MSQINKNQIYKYMDIITVYNVIFIYCQISWKFLPFLFTFFKTSRLKCNKTVTKVSTD